MPFHLILPVDFYLGLPLNTRSPPTFSQPQSQWLSQSWSQSNNKTTQIHKPTIVRCTRKVYKWQLTTQLKQSSSMYQGDT